jgi:hypothetical protein
MTIRNRENNKTKRTLEDGNKGREKQKIIT